MVRTVSSLERPPQSAGRASRNKQDLSFMAILEFWAYKALDQRGGRRRPFSTWVKKLTNFKGSSSSGADESGRHASSKRNYSMRMHAKRRSTKKNNPYPQSGYPGSSQPRLHQDQDDYGYQSRSGSDTSLERRSLRSSIEEQVPPTAEVHSVAPTISTDHDTSRSIAAVSHGASSVTGTSRTVGGGLDSRRGGDSTFSSPAPSVRSLTTTLTTIQSIGNGNTTHTGGHGTNHNANGQTITFNQPFPTASPASALPAHLAPGSHPTTYTMATANNLLTDNASILTLASSSKRRRRRSFDTDASVRALAPSSLWGGSRESLPLSVLSANIDGSAMPTTPGLHQGGSRMAGGTERTSIYSATGVVPALPSERNSFYAKQSIAGDGASVRSGLLGHNRAESINGSIGGLTSPLSSPREVENENVPVGKEAENEMNEKETLGEVGGC
jgi:hypothetical protein